jgi:hypothetical protein
MINEDLKITPIDGGAEFGVGAEWHRSFIELPS